MHALAEVHDTPVSLLPIVPGGVRICSMDQEVPFHASATARPSDPAAVQALAAVQDTPLSVALPGAGTGSGICWTDHAVPFHCSAAGAFLFPAAYHPVAVQSVA
jgi:hypothetical protein